jgi:hypothetical protein
MGLTAAWVTADRLATERREEPPSDRAWLVERVAWGLHAARGLPSPRAAWADMPEVERAELYVAARGAVSVFEARLRGVLGDLLQADPHVCTCGHNPAGLMKCDGCSEGWEDRCRFEARLRAVVEGVWDEGQK